MSDKIGIKLADGTFYPVLENSEPQKKDVELTTVRDNQSAIKVNLYKTSADNITKEDYVDTLLIENLLPQKKGEPSLLLEMSLDEKGFLSAEVTDMHSGAKSKVAVSLAEKNDSSKNESFHVADESSDDESATGVVLGATVAGAALIGAKGAKKKSRKSKKTETEMEKYSEEENKMHLDEYNDMDSLLVDTSVDSEKSSSSKASLDDSILSEDFPEDFNSQDLSLDDDIVLDDEKDNFEKNNFKVGAEMDDDFNFPEEKDEQKLETEDSFADSDFPSFEEEKTENTSSYSTSSSPLYDEDTFDETSKDKKKKVIIPVVICGLIAVIAVVVLLVYMFLIKPKKAAEAYQPVYVEETKVEKVQNDAAREDEIIIVETPVVSPATYDVEEEVLGEVIDYKIKWGDTLWDISKTYYKTPWQYQFLADYNGIKNPDFILAGAHLDIPPK